MKKPRANQRRFQRRKSAYVMRMRSRSKSRKVSRKPNTRRSDIAQNVLAAPSRFIVQATSGQQNKSDVDEYFSFLSKLRAVRSCKQTINMKDVHRMSVDATLLFKAELSRLIELHSIRFTAIAPTSSRAQQVLKQTGIDQLLNLKIDIEPSREDVIHWRIAEGPRDEVDTSNLEIITEDIEEVTGMKTHPVYQGIIESIGNCVEHAYKDHPDVTWKMPERPGWWIFQQVKEGRLMVVVCDLGIGVNRALPLTLANEEGALKKLIHLFRRTKGEDARALLAAMEYGRSSTKRQERGKGMQNAHAVIDDHGEGDFYAISNRGCYTYNRRPQSTKGQSNAVRLRHSIHGTILGWSLPLNRPSTESIL